MQETGPWLIQVVGDTWLAPAEVPISIRGWKMTEGRTGTPEDTEFERRGAAFDAQFSESHRTMFTEECGKRWVQQGPRESCGDLRWYMSV